MIRTLTFLLLIITYAGSATAQRKTILIDPQTRKVNQGATLPALDYFDMQVPVSNETGIIKVNIYKGKTTGKLIEQSYWARPVNFMGNLAELPVSSKLSSNSAYTFEVVMYTMLSDSERVHLKDLIKSNINAYLNAIMESDKTQIDMARNDKRIVADLDAIVIKSMTYYKNIRDRKFEGFSDIVSLKVQQLSNARLKNAAYNIKDQPIDSATTEVALKNAYANRLISELEAIVWKEAENYLDLDFVKVNDQFVVYNQLTEKTTTVLPLFVGYGGVYFDGDINDLEYDSQPYAGIAIPLGRGKGSYFSRTSFVFGVYINNFKDGEGNTVTGPIVNRPVFAGLGFRIFEFLHFNAGAVATSQEKVSLSNFKTQDVTIKPFVGVSAQFNLWLGLGKK